LIVSFNVKFPSALPEADRLRIADAVRAATRK
jgi:hypothetical protein